MRMAGQVWDSSAKQMGKGCATSPPDFPTKPRGGASHGPQLLGQKYVT